MLVVPVLDIDFRTEKSQTPSSIQYSPLQVNFLSRIYQLFYRVLQKTGDYIIKKRRAMEEKRDALRADVQERIVIGGIAKWEVSTAKRIEANRAMTYFNKMKEEAAEKLTERRKRLAAKLSREQEQYEIEVENSFETAEERAARLAERALKLKADRAARMKKASEDARFRQFRNSCDELRGKDKQIVAELINDYRMNQIKMKEDEAARKQQEVNLKRFAKVRVRRFFFLSLDAELAARARKNQEIKSILDQQVAEKKMVENWHAKKNREDDAENIKRWEAENKEAAKEKRMRRVRAFEAYKKVMEENREIEEKKKTWGDADAAHTKWLLDEAIRKEEADIAREREVKERIRREAMDYQKQLEQQMIREMKDDSELEAIRRADVEKTWKKREDQWAREAAARAALLKEVNDTRDLQIREKQALKEMEKAEDLKWVGVAKEKYEQDYKKEKDLAKYHRKRQSDAQEQLLDQIQANQIRRDKERQRVFFEDRARKKQEEIFNQQLASMRATDYKPRDFRKKKAGWFS
eukprot:g12661.t1